MKRRSNLILVLCLISLLISVFTLAQEPEEVNQLTFEEQFLNNPTAQNFENFMKENPQKAADYLAQNYNNEFAQKFYDGPDRLGLNPELDDRYISGDGNKEQSTQNIGHNVAVAATYFTEKFGKDVKIENVPAGFFFDASKNSLILGQSEYPISTYSNIVGVRVTETDVILIPAETEGIGEISTTGGKEGKFSYQDGNIIFTDALGTEQKFSITGSKPTRFNFQPDGTLEIQGPVKGIVWTDSNNYVDFTNRVGTLVIKPNGDIKTENAEVLTRQIYVDGKLEKVGNLITAQDHGDRGKGNIDTEGRTVIVDRTSRVGIKTQGQNGENNVKIHLDELPSNSDAAKPEPQSLEEAKDLAKNIRPPKGDLENNAEVWIKKDEQGTSVVAKGKVDVGFYDVGPNGGISSGMPKPEPHFVGHNGKSELELRLGSKTQISLRGKVDYSDDQYSTAGGERFGIQTVQDGASLKITRDAGSKEDIIYANCFDCERGFPAIRIQKTVAIGDATDIPGVISSPEADSLKIVIKVDENGNLGYFPADDTTLGKLAKAQTEGQRLAIGRDIKVAFPCGDNECTVELKNERGLGTAQAFYEEYDGKTTRTVPIDTGYGTVIGEEKVLISAEEKAKVDRLLQLVKAKQYGAIAQANLEIKDNPVLKALIFNQLGLKIDLLNDPAYGQKVETIVRHYDQAQNDITQLEGLGIHLDERGRPQSTEDAQKINALKRQSKEFDLFTKIQENILRSDLANLQIASEVCRGNTQCPSQAQIQADFEKTKKQLVNVVNQREAAYREFKRQEWEYLKNHPPEGAENAQAEAVQLGKDIKKNQQDQLRIEATLQGTKETPGAEARAATAKQRYEQLKEEYGPRIEYDRLSRESTIGFTEESIKREIGGTELESELNAARDEYYRERDLVNTLRKNLQNAQDRESNARVELEYLSGDFVAREDVIANLYFAAGLTDEAAEFVDESPYLADQGKQELLQSFKGHSESQALERSEFLASLGTDQSIAEAAFIQQNLEERQPGIVTSAQFQKASDALNNAIIARENEQSQVLEEQIARHQQQTTERRAGIFTGPEDWKRSPDLFGTAFELVVAPPVTALRAAGVISEDVDLADYVGHVAGRALEKAHEPTFDYVLPFLASAYVTPVAPTLDLLAATGVIREGGVESLREYGAYSSEKTEQEEKTMASLLEQREYAQKRNSVLQAYADRGLPVSDALRDMETGNYNPRVLQYNPELEGKPIVYKREGLQLPEGNTVVLRELANGRLPEETAEGREGLAAQALQRAENEEAIHGGKTAFVEHEFKEVSTYAGTLAASEADAKVQALEETTLGISERTHQTIVEPVGEGLVSIDAIVTAPFDVIEIFKVANAALKAYKAERALVTLEKLVVHGTEEAKIALRLARQEIRAAKEAGDVARLEKLREQFKAAAETAQAAKQEARAAGRVADLGHQVKVSPYRRALAEEYQVVEQKFAQAVADAKEAQRIGDVAKAQEAQNVADKLRFDLDNLAELDQAAKIADARPAAERVVGEIPVSEKVRDAERAFEEAQDARRAEEQVLGEARVRPETQEQARVANENLAASRAEELSQAQRGDIVVDGVGVEIKGPSTVEQKIRDRLAVEGFADSDYGAAVRQKAAAESGVVPLPSKEKIKPSAFDPCTVAGGAIYGMAGCVRPTNVVTSSINQDKTLVNLAADAGENQAVQRALDHLTEQISQGNFPGRVRHVEGTDVFYIGTDNGARAYYRRVGQNQYDIVAKSAKGRNQDQVINRLKKIYGRCSLVAAAIYGSAACPGEVVSEVIEEVEEITITGPRVPSARESIPGKREIPFVSTADPTHNLYLDVLQNHKGGKLPKEVVDQLRSSGGWVGQGAENVVVRVTDEEFLAPINAQRRAAGKPELKASIDNPLILKIRNTDTPFGNSPEWLQKIHGDLCATKAATCLEEVDFETGLWQVTEEAKGPDLEQLIQNALTEADKVKWNQVRQELRNEVDQLTRNADEAKKIIRKRALEEGRELTDNEEIILAGIDDNVNRKIENAHTVSRSKTQDLLNPYAEGGFDAVEYEGRNVNVRQKTEKLFDKLRDANTEVLDANYRNIKCIDAECTDLVVVDLGAATQGRYSTITNPGVAEDYVRNALTGGNFDISPKVKNVLEQNLETPGFVPEIEEIQLPSCPLGGALAGQAAARPCLPKAAPKSLTNLEEGNSFRVKSKRGNSYGGRYLSTDDEFITIQIGEEKRFFGLFGSKPETSSLRITNLDESTLIREGDQIRLAGNDGTLYAGKYAGEDAEFFRITYPSGETVRFRKTDLDFSTIVGEGEEITLKSKSGNTYSGEYVAESPGNIFLKDKNTGRTYGLNIERIDQSSIRSVTYQEQPVQKIIKDTRALFADAEKFPSHQVKHRQVKNVVFEGESEPRQIVYSVTDRKTAERAGFIFENVPSSRLPPGQYTYVILEDGSLVFGKVSNNLEFGVKHLHLANGRSVKAAGEVAIDGLGNYVFNLRSGTFTSPIRDQKFEQFKHLGTAVAQQEVAKFDRTLQKNMDEVFGNYFGRKGSFTPYEVLPNAPSSLDELVDICVRSSGLNLPACGFEDVKVLVDQRRGAVVSDAADACAFAGGAIYGAACRVPEPPSFAAEEIAGEEIIVETVEELPPGVPTTIREITPQTKAPAVTPLPEELQGLRDKIEPSGIRWEAAPNGKLRYNLDNIRFERTDIDGIDFEFVNVEDKIIGKEEFLSDVKKAEDLANGLGQRGREALQPTLKETLTPGVPSTIEGIPSPSQTAIAEKIPAPSPQAIQDELTALRNRLDASGGYWEATPNGRLQYNIDNVRFEKTDIGGIDFEFTVVNGEVVGKEDFLRQVSRAEDLTNSGKGRVVENIPSGVEESTKAQPIVSRKGDNLFEIEGKEYSIGEDGLPKEKREKWKFWKKDFWRGERTLNPNNAEDAQIIALLEENKPALEQTPDNWLRTSEIPPEKIPEPGGVRCIIGGAIAGLANCGAVVDENVLKAAEEHNIPLETRPITPEVTARRAEQREFFRGRSSAVIDNGELTVGGLDGVRDGRPVIVVDNNPFAGKSAKDLESVEKFKASTPWLEVIDHHGVYDDGVDKHAFDRIMEWLDGKSPPEREALLASIQRGDTLVLTNAQNLDPDGIWSFFALTNPDVARQHHHVISQSDFYTDFSFFGSDTFDGAFDVAKASDEKKLGFIVLQMINEQKKVVGAPFDARKIDEIFHNILDELPEVLKNLDSPKNIERYENYARRLQAVHEEAKKVTKPLGEYVSANPQLLENPTVAKFAAENPNAVAVIEASDFLDKSEIYDWLAESAGRYTTDAPVIVAYNQKTGRYLIAQRYRLPGQRTSDVDLTTVIAKLNEAEGRPIWYGRAAVAVDVGGSQLPRERVLEIIAEEWERVYEPKVRIEAAPESKGSITGSVITEGAEAAIA